MPPIPSGVDPITYIPPAARAAAANGATVAQQVAANPVIASKTITPTVVTDANIRENRIPDIQQNVQKTLQQYKGTNGALTNPDGTPVAAPQGSQQSSNGMYYDKNGNTYNAPPAADGTTTTPGAGSSTPATGSAGTPADTSGDNEYDSYLKSIFSDNPSTPTSGAAPANDPYFSMLSQMKATSDASTKTMIEATQKTFAQRQAQLAATQAASHRGLMQALIANGEARYAPILAGQALSADETSHILAMSSIDAEESAAVAQLQKAQNDQDYQTMGKWLDHLDTLRSDKLTAAGKLADSAAAATKALNDAKAKVADSVSKIVEDAAKNGATTEQLAAISSAPDVGSAIAAAGDSLKTYQSGIVGEYQYYIDQAKKAGQTPLSFDAYQTMDANRKAKATAVANGAGGLGSIDTSIFDPTIQKKLDSTGFTKYAGGVQNLAQQLATGQIAPSELSKRTTGATPYNDVLTAADAYTVATTGKHFNIAQADRDYKFATRPQTQDTLNYLGSLVGSVDGTGATTGGNLDDLVTLSNNIKRTSFPAINDIAGWTRYSTGDPKIAAFQATATEVADQVAKILQGGGSSGTSDAKLQQAANLFNTGFSKAQLVATVEALKPLLANRAKSMIKDNAYLSDYADQFGIEQKPGSQLSTGKQIVVDETSAQDSIKSYVTANPVVQTTIKTQMQSMESTLGRPITAQEFLQAFPEYATK